MNCFLFPIIRTYLINLKNAQNCGETKFYKKHVVIALTASIHHNFFDGNGIVDDLTGDFSDPTMAEAEHIYSATPDMTNSHISGSPDIGYSGVTDFNPDMGYTHPNATGVMYNTDINHIDPNTNPFVHDTGMGHPDISSDYAHVGIDNMHPDMNVHMDGTFAHSSPDLMGGNFMHVYGGTNMVDIPHIQHNPYMIFNDSSVQGNTQIAETKTYNYWFNDAGLNYWFDDNTQKSYGADLGTKDVGAIVALHGYEAACYIGNQYKGNPKHFPQVFYDRLNP